MQSTEVVAPGTRLTYRSLMGGRVAVVALEPDAYTRPGMTLVKVTARRNSIYPHGHVTIASNSFLTERK